MIPRSSSLPEHVKRQLLLAARAEMDECTYNYVIDTIGEDGLVDLILMKMADADSLSCPAKSAWAEDWERFTSSGGGDIWLWVFMAMCCGPWIIALCIFIMPIYIFRGALKETLDRALTSVGGDYGSLIASIVGIALLGGAGFGLWKAFPWLVNGVQNWWSWLGGHFQ